MDAPSSAPAAPPSSDTSTASSNRSKIQRSTLPVDACRSDILKLVADNQFVIITGDTGSGKSTQLAQFLHAAGYAQSGAIAITQPRRVGAVSVSRRVSQEMGVHLGDEVGYMIRFEDCTSAKTKIKFMTDGCLLREALTHKNLEPYSIVVLDEAHERSLQTDILFGLIREIAPRRPDIKFIVTSATLDARQFSSFFFNCPTYHVPGRCFPVEIVHGAHTESRYYVERAVEQALLIHANEPLGDVLVFLTGEEEINRACALLGKKVDSMLDDGYDLIFYLSITSI
jgi:pre-mRNA-splicing factor ATP-dependent RNA helicase DHX38/PRP16